eukprot:2035832-Rhodomonas_salina.2
MLFALIPLLPSAASAHSLDSIPSTYAGYSTVSPCWPQFLGDGPKELARSPVLALSSGLLWG